MSDTAGTVRAVKIEGIPYRAAGDINISEILSTWENSMIPTSGKAMRKMVKRIPAREGVVLIVNDDEAEELKTFAESTDDLKLAYVTAGGSEYKSEGTIEIENRETEENRMTTQLLPREKWVKF
jgi:hypothetical protein